MEIVPLQEVPNQTLQCQLAQQAFTLNIYQFAYGLFMDVLVDNVPIISGVICLNNNRIVRSKYLGFDGDFVFIDALSSTAPTDPIYTGLGTQYLLVYLEEADLVALGL